MTEYSFEEIYRDIIERLEASPVAISNQDLVSGYGIAKSNQNKINSIIKSLTNYDERIFETDHWPARIGLNDRHMLDPSEWEEVSSRVKGGKRRRKKEAGL